MSGDCNSFLKVLAVHLKIAAAVFIPIYSRDTGKSTVKVHAHDGRRPLRINTSPFLFFLANTFIFNILVVGQCKITGKYRSF